MPLGQIAEITGSKLDNPSDAEIEIGDAAPLSIANEQCISFLSSAKFVSQFNASSAAACFIREVHKDSVQIGKSLLINDNPQYAYVELLKVLYPAPSHSGGVSPHASIAKSATVGAGTQIQDFVVIEEGAKIGANCKIGSNSVIKANAELGDNSSVGTNVTVSHSIIGNNVTIHDGVRIGQDGFSYLPGPNGLVKIPQLGRVLIGSHVEIGANSTIDRGAGEDTIVGDGTKIDNLVQIGHNCKIGNFCIFAGQVGLSGSVTVGDFSMLGGQVGVADHVHIGKGVQIAAKSGIMRDIPDGERHAGIPAKNARQHYREVSALEGLAQNSRIKK